MAGLSNRLKSSSQQFSYDIFFDGALLSNTRGTLVVELIKYFLYERQQIPLPVDELKEQVAHQENLNLGQSEEKTDHTNGCENKKMQSLLRLPGFYKPNALLDSPLNDRTNFDAPGTNIIDRVNCSRGIASNTKSRNSQVKAPVSKGSQDRKGKALIKTLTNLFESLQKAFEICPEIEQVAVILGGTVLNPKESYLITFPPPCPEADGIPLLSCKQTLFQQIISEDILGTMSSTISLTSMTILVSAPRSCPLKGFLPKQFMQTPKTGAIISFNFHCNYLLPVCHDLTFCDGDFEMSGIVPLDHQDKTLSVKKNKQTDVTEADNDSDRHPTEDKTSGENSPNASYEFQMASALANIRLSLGGNAELESECRDPSKISSDDSGYSDQQKINPVDQSPYLKPLCQIRFSPSSSSAIDPEPDTDCIWYQSPFVIKGYRIQDHHNYLMCS